MSDIKQELGLFSGISNDDYHKGLGLSSTMLKYYIDAPRIYQGYKTGELVFNQTPAMDLGTAVHKLVLEPDDFEKEIVIEPELKKPTSAQVNAKKPSVATLDMLDAWAQFNLEAGNRLRITKKQWDQAQCMADAIREHPEAKDLFNSGEAEMSGYYLDFDENIASGTHMLCKYRPDWRHDQYIADIKTCRDASEQGFMRAIIDRGYHISAAHYIQGDQIVKKTNHRQFIFVCVEPEPPYLVAVYVLDEKALKYGEWLRRKALKDLKSSRKNNRWASYNDDLATFIKLPNYLYYDMEMENI